jgi:hypothetical protein
MKEKRSLFSLNKLEIFVATITIVVTWVGLHAVISSFGPVGFPLEVPLPSEVVRKRELFFNTWVAPIAFILAFSSIFLVRGIQNQNIQGFSRFSYFVSAWPLVLFPSVTVLYFFSLYCFPFGLILPVLSIFESFRSRRWRGGVFAIVWIVCCTIIAWYYFERIDYLFGD